MISKIRPLAVVAAVLAFAAAASQPVSAATDAYAEAVQHSGRSAADLKRDAGDHPADVLRAAGIKPGMRVVDFLAADGYYSELLSYVVGPNGHVVMLNNAAFDHWSDGAWQARVAKSRLPNVEHKTVDVNHMGLGEGTVDAVLMVKVYHDLYVGPDGPNDIWPKIDVSETLDQIAKALKPGGTLLLVDHSAMAGTGSSAAVPLHRIDEAFTKKDFESRGLKLVGHSDVLRRPEDKRDLLSYKGPALGKTDRFVLVFRKA